MLLNKKVELELRVALVILMKVSKYASPGSISTRKKWNSGWGY